MKFLELIFINIKKTRNMRLLKCATLIMAVFFNLRFVSGQGQCVTPSLTLPTYSSTLNCSGSYLDYSVNPSSPQDEPIITIRVNIHVIENSNHTGNFLNNAATINFLSGLFAADNTISPHTMNFTPYGHVEQATWTINLGGGPVPFISDTRIRFRLTGIYFHTDDIGWNYNNNSSCGDYCFTNWGINKYQDINIFFFNYTGPAFGCGPRAGYINMGANWSSYDVNDVSNLWGIRTLLGHEMGHILGLSHTAFWDGITNCAISDDAFDDTPYPDNGHFNNCVPLNGTQTGCNVVSNNVMGYNQCKGYFSPKQIAAMRYYTSAHLKSYMDCPITPSTQYNITTTQVWNTEKILDGSLKITFGGNLTVDCKLFMPQNTTIEVESGGQLTIDGVLGSVCEGGWDGLIDVKPGGILRLSADAEVTLKGNGKILIEDDPTDPGKLIFEQGAEVYLDDFPSSIEINGNLEIANNATFEFKHHAFQHGYVKFGNTSQFPSRNITAGSSASINLVGSAINLTVLEIDQETFYAPASLVNFNISHGKVVFNAGSRLQADGYGTNINFTAARFTSNTPGVNNGH